MRKSHQNLILLLILSLTLGIITSIYFDYHWMSTSGALPVRSGSPSASGSAHSNHNQETFYHHYNHSIAPKMQVSPKSCSFAAQDMKHNIALSYHGQQSRVQASIIKLPIAVVLYHSIEHDALGNINAKKTISIRRKDLVAGTGSLRFALERKTNIDVTISQLAHLMLAESDNVATNALINLLGMPTINQTLDRWSLRQTRLRRPMMALNLGLDQENISTADEMIKLLKGIIDHSLISSHASLAILESMGQVRAALFQASDGRYSTASKTGTLPGIGNEVGYIFLPNNVLLISIMCQWDHHRKPLDLTILVKAILLFYEQTLPPSPRQATYSE